MISRRRSRFAIVTAALVAGDLASKAWAGRALGDGPIVLESGAYYEMTITADGSAELALAGPAFFRAIWMDEIVINKIEIRPMAIDSLEFDDEGVMEISFVTIRPGTFTLQVPGTTSDSQKAVFNVK